MAGRSAQIRLDPAMAEQSHDRWESLASSGSVRGELVARAARLSVPLSAQIETTARCNLRCVHCYLPGDHAHSSESELSLARQMELVEELADAGCMFLTLTGGEVSLKQGWLDLVEGARRRRMCVSILTNGTRLTSDDAVTLARLKVRAISISIYGDSPGVHDGITGVTGSFDRSLAAVRRLRSEGIPVRLATVLMKRNVGVFDGVRRLADSLGCSYRFEPTVRPMADGDGRPLEHRVPGEALYELFADPVIGPLTAEGRWARLGRHRSALDPNTCSGGTTAVFIDASGEVFPCPGFLPGFGSLRSLAFDEVWRGPQAESFRDRMAEPVSDCIGCGEKQYCLWRCPSLAAIEDGSVSGRSSRACELARVVKRLCEAGGLDTLATPRDAGVLTATSMCDSNMNRPSRKETR